jgi:quinol monooxygenase YgiN
MYADYPYSEDLAQIDDEIEEILENPMVKEMIKSLRRGAANDEDEIGGDGGWADTDDGEYPEREVDRLPKNFNVDEKYNLEFGRDQYKVTDKNYSYLDPYPIEDIGKMIVCRTSEYNPYIDKVVVIEANPNDPKHIFDAMGRNPPKYTTDERGRRFISNGVSADDARRKGLLDKFHELGFTSTSHISSMFAGPAMDEVYKNKENKLKPSIVSAAINQNASPFDKKSFTKEDSNSYMFAAQYKGFHDLYRKNLMLQMNHRLTQEAIEKNREYYPSGHPRDPNNLGMSFTWDSFEAIAKQCANDAFKRTMEMMKFQHTHDKVNKKLQTFTEKFDEKIKPKIKNDDIIQAFGREFKRHKGESWTKAIKRIRPELKAFAAKKFDEMKDKGMIPILAKAIAESRGSKVVTEDHLKRASQAFEHARKNPIEFRSAAQIVRQVTGNDRELTRRALHSLDGRSSQQRSFKDLEAIGARLHAHQNGRTRVRKEDKIHGTTFAASALIGVPPKPLSVGRSQAIREFGYSVEEAKKVRKAMQKNVGRIKDDAGKDKTREQLLKRAEKATDQKIEPDQSQGKPKPGGNDQDDGGYTPDGSGGGRGKRRR